MKIDIHNISKSVEGPNLRLRLIDLDDASYVFGLRTDPKLSRHLSAVAGTVQDQRRWIETYKVREARSDEFYFIIERRNGLRCGTVRIYNISDDSFTWGSWILDANKSQKAALESVILSLGFGFNHLKLNLARIYVQAENDHAIAFYRRFGMVEIRKTTEEIEFKYTRAQYETNRPAYLKILENEAGL